MRHLSVKNKISAKVFNKNIFLAKYFRKKKSKKSKSPKTYFLAPIPTFSGLPVKNNNLGYLGATFTSILTSENWDVKNHGIRLSIIFESTKYYPQAWQMSLENNFLGVFRV